MNGIARNIFQFKRGFQFAIGFAAVAVLTTPTSLASSRACSDFLLAIYDSESAKNYLGEQVRFHRFAGQGEAAGPVEGSLENITASGLTVTLADGRRTHIPMAMVQLDSIELNPKSFAGSAEKPPSTELQKFAEQKLRSGAQVSPQEMRKLYEKAGWELVRVTGSHHQYRILRNGAQWVETIPGVNGDIPSGLRKALLKRLIESEAVRTP